MARILVIEDEGGLRHVLAGALAAAGHDVVEAENGKEALLRYGQTRPDLVITDLYMPEMDGMEVVIALRKASPALKVIVISGGGDLHMPDIALKTALALGAFRAIDKPFELQPFLETVEQALAA